MKTRIITAVIALAVFAAVLLAPPIVFTIALGAVIIFMLYECYSAIKADTAMKIVGFVSAVFIMFMLWFGTTTYGAVFAAPVRYCLTGVIILLNIALIVFKHGKRSYTDILSNGFIAVYISFSMMCIWLTRHYFDTNKMIVIFLGAWVTDTFAYISGRMFGRHKLIPHVSPNKTVEGAIGGIIGTVIVCSLYMGLYNHFSHNMLNVSLNTKMDILWFVSGGCIGLFCGIFSQLGDLAASSIKRDSGIKDFGWIFPGHGGFMDRFDSVIFIAPIVLILMELMNIIIFIVQH